MHSVTQLQKWNINTDKKNQRVCLNLNACSRSKPNEQETISKQTTTTYDLEPYNVAGLRTRLERRLPAYLPLKQDMIVELMIPKKSWLERWWEW